MTFICLMSIILRPFRGYLPPSEECSEVACPAYDVIDRQSATRLARSHPSSLIHVLHPEVAMPADVPSTHPSVFGLGKENLKKWISAEIVKRHSSPAFYLYRQRLGGHVQRGIFGLASCEQYRLGLIKRHEETRSAAEAAGLATLRALNANLSSVFLAFKSAESPSFGCWIASHMRQPPHRRAVLAADGSEHELWIVDGAAELAEVGALVSRLSALYIADGHHRAACAARFFEERPRPAGDPAGLFLACLFADTELRILDFNRVVTEVKADPADVIRAIGAQGFRVEEDAARPIPKSASAPLPRAKFDKPHTFGIFCKGLWYRADFVGAPKAEGPASRIDAQILTDFVLEPVFGINDLKTAANVKFVAGSHGLHALEKAAEDEEGIAFAMPPVDMGELFAVADAGEIMPPKSTWFLPKLATGMVFRVIESDE
jgi:uncharacterized protein (DUF1015 family)